MVCPKCGKDTLVNVSREEDAPREEFHCHECNYHGDGSLGEMEEAPLMIRFPEGIALVVVVKHPGETARVINSEIESPHEFIQDFKSVWDDIGEKVKAELVRGFV